MNEFFTKANIDGIIVGVIGGLILALILFLFPKIFKWIGKLFGIFGNWLLTKVKNMLEKMKENREYKRTIGQIERKEIPVPFDFLKGKSRENNPELRKIYQMIDDGEIKMGLLYHMQNYDPELKKALSNVSKDMLKNTSENPPKVNLPKIKIPPFDK